jgi:hypothetical protein
LSQFGQYIHAGLKWVSPRLRQRCGKLSLSLLNSLALIHSRRVVVLLRLSYSEQAANTLSHAGKVFLACLAELVSPVSARIPLLLDIRSVLQFLEDSRCRVGILLGLQTEQGGLRLLLLA